MPANKETVDAPVDQTKSDGSVWQSLDGGKSWIERSKGNDKSINTSGADILSLAVDAYNSDVAYAGARGAGILKTEDGGQNWKYLPFQSEKVYGLDLNPINSEIVYASGVWQKRGKIFKSPDGGKTWEEIYTSPSDGPLIIALRIDKKNPVIIYAATSDNQVIETMDGGKSWKSVFTAPDPITKIAIDKLNGNLIYLSSLRGDVFKSTDGGKNFENISQNFSKLGLSNQNIGVLETDPQNAGWVYVAGGVGILRSKDGGKTWEKIKVLGNSDVFPVKSLTVSPKNSAEIIYGAAQAVYKSVDGGINWTTTQFETSKSINVLKHAMSNPSMLYLGLGK
jgi:photosystem II stability/assembly factor-like uncharacterized protein